MTNFVILLFKTQANTIIHYGNIHTSINVMRVLLPQHNEGLKGVSGDINTKIFALLQSADLFHIISDKLN